MPDWTLDEMREANRAYDAWRRRGGDEPTTDQYDAYSAYNSWRNDRRRARAAGEPTPHRAPNRRSAEQAYLDWQDIGLTVNEMARLRGVQPESVERTLQRAAQREAAMAAQPAVQIQTTDGPDLSWPPPDAADPRAWAEDRAAMWNRIGHDAEVIDLDPTQQYQPELEATA